MREAPVGWQCARCVHQDSRHAPVTRWAPRSAGRLGSTRLTPVVIALIVINVAVYIWERSQHAGVYVFQGFPNACANTAECRFALWPYAVHHGQWYRLITAAFLHESVPHIALNMASLAIVGPAVEAELGKLRFGALYLLSALGGSVASYLLSPAAELGLGASGAIFGLFGAYFAIARTRRWDTSTILVLIVVNLLFGFSGNIDWRAHLGGLITGGIVALGMARSVDLRRTATRVVEVATGAGTTLAAAGVLVILTLLPPGHVNL
jgi:membrane associated rhomboid family serine protease